MGRVYSDGLCIVIGDYSILIRVYAKNKNKNKKQKTKTKTKKTKTKRVHYLYVCCIILLWACVCMWRFTSLGLCVNESLYMSSHISTFYLILSWWIFFGKNMSCPCAFCERGKWPFFSISKYWPYPSFHPFLCDFSPCFDMDRPVLTFFSSFFC